jgi:large subunit ribosomal protein L18
MARIDKRSARKRRHVRIRQTVRGSQERPRLVVFRSNAGIYAQLVDDRAGHTLAAASSLDSGLEPDGEGKIGVAKAVGRLVAQRAQDAGIDAVVFDRGGNRYMGRVAALAEGAREGGLKF